MEGAADFAGKDLDDQVGTDRQGPKGKYLPGEGRREGYSRQGEPPRRNKGEAGSNQEN